MNSQIATYAESRPRYAARRRRNVVIVISLLTIVAIVIIGLRTCWFGLTQCHTITLYVNGGYRYFEDEEILSVLRKQYGIEMAGEFRMGSFAQVDNYDPSHKPPIDCIFPSTNIAVNEFKQQRPDIPMKAVVVADDRIIVYTWRELLPTLEKSQLVYKQGNVYYIRMQPLVAAMIANKTWKDVGINIPGLVRIETTDALKSTTGAEWMAMTGSYLVPDNDLGSQVLTLSNLADNPTILPNLYDNWERQGFQEDTTSKLFQRFVNVGSGIKMMVAYESSFTDWYYPLPPAQQGPAAQIVGLYPEATTGVEHTLVALHTADDSTVSPACEQLQTILTHDSKIIDLAWTHHGLCTRGSVCPTLSSAPWIAHTVPLLIPEPKKEVTDRIQLYIQAYSECYSEGGTADKCEEYFNCRLEAKTAEECQ